MFGILDGNEIFMHYVYEVIHVKLQYSDFGQLELLYDHTAPPRRHDTYALHKLWSVFARFLIAPALELSASFNNLDNIF